MNRPNRLIFFLCLFGSAFAQAEAPRMLGVQVTMISRGSGEVDRETYRQALRLAGALVQYEVVDKFIVSKHGRGGGSTFCLEINPAQPAEKVQQIVRGFMRFSPDRITTSFSVYQVEKCTARE